MKIILSEYDAFARLSEGMSMAADGARMMAVHQSDKAHMWLKMADTYEVAVKAIYKLSEESALKSAQRFTK